MHLFLRSQGIPIHSMPPFNLPPELWELVCSFLPEKEVCRLRSLNAVFFCCALTIHYGTLIIRPDDPQIIPSLDALKRPYIADKVHTLHLKNHINIPPFYSPFSLVTRSLPASLTRRFLRRPISRGLKRPHNIKNLHLEFGPISSKSFVHILFRHLSQTLVHLDICFKHLDYIDISWLDTSLFCPNVRSLGLTLDDEGHMKHGPSADVLELAVLKIRSLVPSTIESLILVELCGSYNASLMRSTSLNLCFLKRLKRLICISCLPTDFVFDIETLINANLDTLVDIRLGCQMALHIYKTLKWGKHTHSISLGALPFYKNQDRFLPQLARCNQLQVLKLEGDFRQYAPNGGTGIDYVRIVDLDETVYQEFYRSLVDVLSQPMNTLPSLTFLQIPFRNLSFDRVWELLCIFPNLDTLIFIGTPDIETRRFMYHVLSFNGGHPSPLKISLHNLRLYLWQVRCGVGGACPSVYFKEHTEEIVADLAERIEINEFGECPYLALWQK